MADDAEHEARIQQLDWSGLRWLWEGISRRDTPNWAPGRAFEYLVLRAFQLDGAEVRWPYSILMEDEVVEQIDGAVHWGWLSCLVESKDTTKPISVEPIAKMRNQLLRRPSSSVGLIFSHAGFTQPAVLLARYISIQTILLWEGEEIDHALKQQRIGKFLERKYRECVETGAPDTNILKARQVLDPEQGDGEGRWGVERVVNLAVLHANTT